jgi:hypothetical protein
MQIHPLVYVVKNVDTIVIVQRRKENATDAIGKQCVHRPLVPSASKKKLRWITIPQGLHILCET